MSNSQMKITDDIFYVGVQDRTKTRFESLWTLTKGVSYNAYLIVDEKVALIDTVEVDFFPQFIESIKDILGDRPIDYLVINHMEPDHSSSISLIRQFYPEVKLVGNKKTFDMVQGFYEACREDDVEVANGGELCLGRHTLNFAYVPMLHWPETMVTFETTTGTLFSGDAFGCFGALNGGVFDHEMDLEMYYAEMERYYACILGKYSAPVQTALKKLSGLPIKTICSTHGPVWTGERVAEVIDRYDKLSKGDFKEGVVICYGSMYGNAQSVAEAIAQGVVKAGVKKVIVHNLTISDPSEVLADIYRYRGLAIGGPTYNGDVYPAVKELLNRLAGRDVKNHKLAIFGGWTWAGAAVKVITGYEELLKMERIGEPLEWKQTARREVLEQARSLGQQLGEAVK
ncbi:MAG: FprA family A-type flavoprotein [Alloprevotella sp.]|nr:FprA family A-type flavoprotein [Alloprevotella sp.]